MIDEQYHLDRIKALQDQFPSDQEHIIALQKEYRKAVDEFRKWAQTNPCTVPKETFKVVSNPVTHKFEWTDNGIRFVDKKENHVSGS